MNEKRNKIMFTIDGAEYSTRDDDQEAAALLRLAGRDPEDFDLAKVKDNGGKHAYRDKQVLDLADGDTFISVNRTKIMFTIDGAEYSTRDDDQEAAALLRLAGRDPEDFDLATVNDHQDRQTFSDTDVVDLRDGDAFATVERAIEIKVNGKLKVVASVHVTFEEVVRLAYPDKVSEADVTFVVLFRKAAEPKEGSLSENGTVTAKREGTIFNVTFTNKS